MRSDIELCNFTAGELSAKLKGRTDYKNYYNGCEKIVNMVVQPQGGATRRPGFMLAAKTKDQTDTPFRSRQIAFIFSTIQAYSLEFTNGNVRVYMNDAVVLNGGVPVDIAVPYTVADIYQLAFIQSTDTLFICHPSYPPATITRSSHTNWSYAAIVFRDGPYLDVNITTTTLTPSGTSGAITLTASSIVGINVFPGNTGIGFQATDVGRMLRIKLFSLWAWVLITHVTDTTHVNATVQGLVNNGAYSAIDGAPWAANTRYPTGACITANGENYIALTGGTSGGPNGPAGTGNNIIDGTVTWSLAGPFNASSYHVNTTYVCGDIVWQATGGPGGAGGYYLCQQGGDSPSGGAPVGTGTGINVSGGSDNPVWEYIAPFMFPTSTIYWQLGKWSATTSYPYVPIFWQNRLCFLGTNNQPSAVEGSVSSDFTNFAPTLADGTVVASNALSWVISDDQANAVRWAKSAGSSVAMQLAIGTSGAEQVMQPATNSLPLSPTNVQVYPETEIGSPSNQAGNFNVPALRIGKSVLFVNKNGRKLMDWIWQWAINGYQPFDRTVDSEHITRCKPVSLQGVIGMAYQQQPFGVVWCVKGDGTLIGLTYLPEQNVIAWHEHQLGGQYYGGAPIVESICSIPSNDGSRDEIWITVLRTIAGVPTRTTEVMAPYFDGQQQEQAFFMDCGLQSVLTYPAATLTPGAISGNGVAFAASANVFAGTAADVGKIIRVNNGIAIVRGFVDQKHVTVDYFVPATSTRASAQNTWSCDTPQIAFGGLAHLNGEMVQIYGDGADLGIAQVVAGSVAIANSNATFAAIGLPTSYKILTMPWAPERALPVPATGKVKNLDHLYLRLHEALGCQYGQLITDEYTDVKSAELDTLETRHTADILGFPTPLFSGIKKLSMPGTSDLEGQIQISGSGPFPCTVIGICASADIAA